MWIFVGFVCSMNLKKNFPKLPCFKKILFSHPLVVTTVALKVDRDKLKDLFKDNFLPFKGLHLATGGRRNIFRLYND